MAPWEPLVTEVEGRFVSASNTTLLGSTDDGVRVVYKPVAGERPLWDFPGETLAVREVLTYRLALALGFDIVPETVIGEGPYGPGSVQRYVDIDTSFDSLRLIRDDPDAAWPVAVLDVIANNADRKLGHILRSVEGALVAIDHGLTFNVEEKLRTVLWVFAGEPLPDDMLAAMETLDDGSAVIDDVATMLGDAEAEALSRRILDLRTAARHPSPPDDRPAVPWPPY